jgi:hypothetical protein
MVKQKEDIGNAVHIKSPICWHWKMLILGVLILLNAYYNLVSWAMFIGGILAIKGLLGLLMPHCGHCK